MSFVPGEYGAPPVSSNPVLGLIKLPPAPINIREVNKEFYTFTAPEEDYREALQVQDAVNHLRDNLRVVFIKNPENQALENAALSLVNSAVNQKTAIYVLNKQTDLSGLASKLKTVHANTNPKPEVFFVKYRTPEDAANAQKIIQSQYDSYGGLTSTFNGGVGSVLNFASRKPTPVPAAGVVDLPLAAAPLKSPSVQYLPPFKSSTTNNK